MASLWSPMGCSAGFWLRETSLCRKMGLLVRIRPPAYRKTRSRCDYVRTIDQQHAVRSSCFPEIQLVQTNTLRHLALAITESINTLPLRNSRFATCYPGSEVVIPIPITTMSLGNPHPLTKRVPLDFLGDSWKIATSMMTRRNHSP